MIEAVKAFIRRIVVEEVEAELRRRLPALVEEVKKRAEAELKRHLPRIKL